MSKKFNLGQVVATRGILDCGNGNDTFSSEVIRAMVRYMMCDFSDMDYQEDVQMNFDAIKSGEDRIFATYNTSQGKIYIITEWDRSVTTILFPYEY